MSSSHHHPDEKLWKATKFDMGALEDIISTHFQARCRDHRQMVEGAYARVFLFTLETERQIIARIVLSVRESIKTEAEIAAMELVRSRTNIPVPEVYLYCASPHNPVGAEWILMEYLPGSPLQDCFETLGFQQRLRLSADLANVLSSLFTITAPQCGSLSHLGGKESALDTNLEVLRHPSPTHAAGGSSSSLPYFHSFRIPTPVDRLVIGPVNDVTFLDHENPIPPQACGPFDSERRFLEALAFRGQPPTRSTEKMNRWPYEKVLEIFDAIRPLYSQCQGHSTSATTPMFHFDHGDFSTRNILVDPDTGAITGVIDWEMAGFRPAWLAAVGPGWFDDDEERFILTSFQEERGNYADDNLQDTIVRAHFRLKLAELNQELFYHHLHGVELRAIFYACCNELPGNTMIWLRLYHDHEWSMNRKDPFPFDYPAWVLDMFEVQAIYFGRKKASAPEMETT